jgi:hypothetical protein
LGDGGILQMKKSQQHTSRMKQIAAVRGCMVKNDKSFPGEWKVRMARMLRIMMMMMMMIVPVAGH